MRVVKFLLELVLRILLIPVWIILLFVWEIVVQIVSLGVAVKVSLSSIFMLFLIFTLIWDRTDWWRYGLLAISEGAVFFILLAGVMVAELLGAATESVGDIIHYGF